MRTVTGGEQTVLEGAHFGTHVRVLVEDADGTYQDTSSLDGWDWLHSGRLAQTVDQIVATGEISFWLKQEGGQSLAPLDESSTLNRNSVPAYAPLVDVGRGIRVELATVAIGSSPSGGDWKRVFQGTIDEWDASDGVLLQVRARDASGAEIADRWVEVKTVYGSAGGIALETVMQSILTDWTSGITLYVPTSPSFLVSPPFIQDPMSVLDALQQLAAMIGWVVEPRWDNGTSAFRLTLYEPDRAASVTDWDWGPDRYEVVPEFKLSRLDVRNALSGWYTDSSGDLQQLTVEDATSIAKYGRQWMEIEEASDSAVNTAAEMNTMLTAAVLDLKDPVAAQQIRTFAFWAVQLGDYYGFTANAVHYDVDQEGGVTGFTHEWGPDGHVDTLISTRGKPAGFTVPWLRRGGTGYRFLNALKSVQLRWVPGQGLIGPVPYTIQKLYLHWVRESAVPLSVGWAWSTTTGSGTGYVDVTGDGSERLLDAGLFAVAPADDEEVTVVVTPYDATGGSGGSGTPGPALTAVIEPWGTTGSTGTRSEDEDNPGTVKHGDYEVLGEGLTLGEDANGRPLKKVGITALTVQATPVASTDYVMTHDDAAGALRKVLIANLVNASAFVFVQDADPSGGWGAGDAGKIWVDPI